VTEFTATLHRFFPEAEVLLAKAAGEASSLAKQSVHDGCELLVAAGGDGTLHEVVNGLVGHFGETRMGLLPLGTGNDFARSIGVPENLEDALGLLQRGRAAQIDVVRITGSHVRHMINVSGGGFTAKVNEMMTDDLKDTWGPLCYARSFVAALPELEGFHTEIVLDDAERLEVAAYNIIVANARYVANGIPIAPRARLDDGLADLIVLPVKSLSQLALLAPATLLGKHLDNDQIIFRRARKISLHSDPPMRFNADGEIFGEGAMTFEVLPGAIEFVIGELPPE